MTHFHAVELLETLDYDEFEANEIHDALALHSCSRNAEDEQTIFDNDMRKHHARDNRNAFQFDY